MQKDTYLEEGGLNAGSGVMVWVIFLHTLDHLLSIGCLSVIIVCLYTDNPPYQMDDDLCFLLVCVCVWDFLWGGGSKMTALG